MSNYCNGFVIDVMKFISYNEFLMKCKVESFWHSGTYSIGTFLTLKVGLVPMETTYKQLDLTC